MVRFDNLLAWPQSSRPPWQSWTLGCCNRREVCRLDSIEKTERLSNIRARIRKLSRTIRRRVADRPSLSLLTIPFLDNNKHFSLHNNNYSKMSNLLLKEDIARWLVSIFRAGVWRIYTEWVVAFVSAVDSRLEIYRIVGIKYAQKDWE